jgi:hypothetical protein
MKSMILLHRSSLEAKFPLSYRPVIFRGIFESDGYNPGILFRAIDSAAA